MNLAAFDRFIRSKGPKVESPMALFNGPTPVGEAPLYVDLSEFFHPAEGTIELIYGHVRNGKTYLATDMLIRLLNKGCVVYSNYPVVWRGRDDSNNPIRLLASLLWPGVFKLRKFSPSNLRYYQISDEWAKTQVNEQGISYRDFWHWFASRTDCVFVADEGHVLLDSYRKTYVSIEERTAVLSTGHYNRRILIISQRPTAIQVSARGNVNIFWKCEKVLHIGKIVLFRRTEFQDMSMETVDESKPLSKRYYFLRRGIAQAYDSKYLRAGMPSSQPLLGQLVRASWSERLRLLRAYFSRRGADIFVQLPEFPGISRPRQMKGMWKGGDSGSRAAAKSNWGGKAAREGVLSSGEKTIKSGVGSTLRTPPDGEDMDPLPF